MVKCDKLNLVLDVKTRWNSTYDMLHRLIRLRKAVDSIIITDTKLHRYKLEKTDWDLLDDVMSKLFNRIHL
jgi:phage anti-repressor protein